MGLSCVCSCLTGGEGVHASDDSQTSSHMPKRLDNGGGTTLRKTGSSGRSGSLAHRATISHEFTISTADEAVTPVAGPLATPTNGSPRTLMPDFLPADSLPLPVEGEVEPNEDELNEELTDASNVVVDSLPALQVRDEAPGPLSTCSSAAVQASTVLLTKHSARSASYNPEWELPFKPPPIRTTCSQSNGANLAATWPPPPVSSNWSVINDQPGIDFPAPSSDVNPFTSQAVQDAQARDGEGGTPRHQDGPRLRHVQFPTDDTGGAGGFAAFSNMAANTTAATSNATIDTGPVSNNSGPGSNTTGVGGVLQRRTSLPAVRSRLSRASGGEASAHTESGHTSGGSIAAAAAAAVASVNGERGSGASSSHRTLTAHNSAEQSTLYANELPELFEAGHEPMVDRSADVGRALSDVPEELSGAEGERLVVNLQEQHQGSAASWGTVSPPPRRSQDDGAAEADVARSASGGDPSGV